MEKTMVSKVINEPKFKSRLKILLRLLTPELY